MKALSRDTEEVDVTYYVQMASPVPYVEDGVEKRTFSMTGGWTTPEAAQRGLDTLKDLSRGDWLWDVVKVTTVTNVTHEKVTK